MLLLYMKMLLLELEFVLVETERFSFIMLNRFVFVIIFWKGKLGMKLSLRLQLMQLTQKRSFKLA